MPARIPQATIDKAVALYSSGLSSNEVACRLGISASTVCAAARLAGVLRANSEAKKLQHKRRPRPLVVIDKSRPYGADSGIKKCSVCGGAFPATFEYFYRRTRSNGRTYLSSKCKPCFKLDVREFREKNPDHVRAVNKRGREKNGHKHRTQKALRLLFDDDHREQRRVKYRAWYEKNRDGALLYRKAYVLENRERVRESWRQYARDNRAAVTARSRRIKAARRGAEGAFSPSDIEGALKSQASRCYWCGADVSAGHHIDHLIPIARGGSNFPSNIVISCPTCNVSRGSKMPEEFREYLRMLDAKSSEITRRRAYLRQKSREARARKGS